MSEQTNLEDRVVPCQPTCERSTAKRTNIEQDFVRLGYISTNLPTCRNAIDKYSCSFGGKDSSLRNEKMFLRYVEEKKKIDLISFGIDISSDCPPDSDKSLCSRTPTFLVYSGKKHEYRHRWAVSYKRRFLYRLHLLENWYRWFDKPVTFLTVTTRQNMPIEDQILYLKEGWDQIKKYYSKYIGHMTYLAAMDFHKTGFAHYHIVIFDVVSKSFAANMSDMWQKKFFGSAEYGLKWKFKKNGEIAKIVNYLFKHTAKVFNLDVSGAMKFHSTVFAMQHCENHEYPGIRLFGMSQDIAKIMKIPESSKECLSFQLDGDCLYIDEDMGRVGVREQIEIYQKWFQALRF